MKKIILTIVLTAGFIASAQVKIGDNVNTINASSILELESTTKGVLFPRVALTSTTAFAPLAAHVAGMTVYNTATAGDVTPGMYTNDGTQWVKLAGGGGGTNLYNANGTLTGARTVTQDNNDLTFTTGTGKTIINGTFKTNGGIYTKYRVATTLAASVPLADDYVIDMQISGAQTLTGILPDPTTVPAGRVIVLRNSSIRGGAGGTYTFSTPDTGYLIAAAANIPSNLSMMLYCDGTKWVRICE